MIKSFAYKRNCKNKANKILLILLQIISTIDYNRRNFLPIKKEYSMPQETTIIEMNLEEVINQQDEKRKESIKLLKSYIENPGKFSILVLGERGTGKTKWIETIGDYIYKGVTDKIPNVITTNCASIPDDTLAISELFGHKKGAFTGAITDWDGKFIQADKKILFLDEFHHLALPTQAKLMTALQTKSSGDNKGKYEIYRLKDDKPEYVQPLVIFGSNLSIHQLKERIYPDLFDRISQLIVKLPSLDETKDSIWADFKKVWEKMQFLKYKKFPKNNTLKNWMTKEIKLEGNFRDLEKIAILWNQYSFINKSEDDNQNNFEFVKQQFDTYHAHSSSICVNTFFNFEENKYYEDYVNDFRKHLLQEAIKKFGNIESAADFLKVSAKTIKNNTK